MPQTLPIHVFFFMLSSMLNTWLNRNTLLTLFCGLILSMAVFMLLKNWEESNRNNEFEYKAHDHAAAIQTEFEHLAQKVKHIRFLIEHDIDIEHDNPLDPDDFMPMAEHLIIDDPQLLSLAWAMRQTDADQLQHLNIIYVKKGNMNDGEISDLIMGEYYDEHIDSRSMLNQSRLVSAFIHKDAGVETNELNFIAPVANRLQHNNQFEGKHIGSLIVEFEVSGLIQRAIAKLPIASQDIALSILHQDGSTELVYQHLSRSRQADESNIHTGLQIITPFEFAGLQWQLKFEAAPQFLRNHPIVLAWLALVFCSILAGFFIWYSQLRRQQTQRIEHKVIVRTRELQQNQLKLRRIIDNLQDVYIQTDSEGILQMCSPSVFALIGYNEDEVIGRNITQYYGSPELRDQLLAALQQSKHGKILNFESSALHRDGHKVYTSNNAQFTYDAQGNINGIEASIRDITEQKQAEQEKEGLQRQIEHTQRLESLGVLAGGIAHDFNNILAAIMGNASLAERKMMDRPHDSQAHLEKIIKASEKAASLCQQMLAYAGKGRFIIESINLSVLLDETTQLLEVSISPNVKLNYNFQDHLPHIDADLAQLQQVFMNFTTNANEAISDAGEISITTGTRYVSADELTQYIVSDACSAGEYVLVSFSDTGCGMDEMTISKIFEPFFTTKFTGRGLGMSAVLGIIKGHHGCIQCDSKPGQGTTFTVLLPVSEQQPAEISHAIAHIEPTQKSSGTVLIIDDEEDIRECAEAMLQDLGMDVLTASNGQQGIDLFTHHHSVIHAVLLDMTMPGLDGLATFDALKAIDPSVKVILSTGYSEQESTDRFGDRGLFGFLQKPYTLEEMQKQLIHISNQI